MSYWKRKVQDWQPVALPYDFSYNTVNSTTSFIQYPINGSLLEDLEALAQQEDIRLSGLFLSVLKVLFYRYCGQEDICIICPNSNQEHNGLTLTNFLPLQSHLNDELSFKDFLKKVEILANEVAMHGEVSFDGIEQTMENENLPLHQVMFALIQDESAFSLDHEKEDFHISFIIEGLSDKPNIKIKYRSDLFLEETINRMARFYEYLLKSVVLIPNESVGKLPMLTASERVELLEDFNQTRSDYSKNKTLVDLFLEQVLRTPLDIATDTNYISHTNQMQPWVFGLRIQRHAGHASNCIGL